MNISINVGELLGNDGAELKFWLDHKSWDVWMEAGAWPLPRNLVAHLYGPYIMEPRPSSPGHKLTNLHKCQQKWNLQLAQMESWIWREDFFFKD